MPQSVRLDGLRRTNFARWNAGSRRSTRMLSWWMRAVARLKRFATLRGDRLSSLRRHVEMLADQAWTLGRWKLAKTRPVEPFDGQPRVALVTVNFSTTRYLKLMLLTLSRQQDLGQIHRVIIVDNDSRDGGLPFLHELAKRVTRVHLVENRTFPNHARGLRSALAALERIERSTLPEQRTNIVLACDTDVIFRDPRAIGDLSAVFATTDAAFTGELRHDVYPYPEAQASFFAVRRDCYARPDVVPFVHHGAPAYWMQRSLWRAGLRLHDFPSNRGGYILHRGRTGVAAASVYRRHDSHATARTPHPHYMNVVAGEAIWERVEKEHESLLEPENEEQLLERLERDLNNALSGSLPIQA
jgi:hypothetical protein